MSTGPPTLPEQIDAPPGFSTHTSQTAMSVGRIERHGVASERQDS